VAGVLAVDVQRQQARVLSVGHEHEAKQDGERRSVVALEVVLGLPADPICDRDRKPRDNLFVYALS
jgi:hypothetical protein